MPYHRQRTWYAVGADADASPPLASLRRSEGPCADVYYYRTLAFCKMYQDTGQIHDWGALAGFVRWADDPADLRRAFEECGIVDRETGLLYLWDETNGWILEKYAADAKRVRDKRAAGKRGARRRWQKARQKSHKTEGGLVGWVRRRSAIDPRISNAESQSEKEGKTKHETHKGRGRKHEKSKR